MAIYTTRISYFESLCYQHQLVRHGHTENDADGNPVERRGFIDVDDPMEELSSAVQNLLHYPCVVQVGFSGKLKYNEGSAQDNLTHTLYFLQKTPPREAGNFPAQLKAAYNTAERVMRDFASKMWDEWVENGNCGALGNIDLDTFTYEKLEYIADTAVGWKLTFGESPLADDIIDFDNTNWGDAPPATGPEIIEFVDEALVVINLDDNNRRARFVPFPQVQVWAKDADEVYALQNVPITLDAPYPGTSTITVDLTGPATGFIILK